MKGKNSVAGLLIIDDDHKICQVLTELVKGMGCEATVANTVNDGLALALENNYDLVLLDLEFPNPASTRSLKSIDFPVSEHRLSDISGKPEKQIPVFRKNSSFPLEITSPKSIVTILKNKLMYFSDNLASLLLIHCLGSDRIFHIVRKTVLHYDFSKEIKSLVVIT